MVGHSLERTVGLVFEELQALLVQLWLEAEPVHLLVLSCLPRILLLLLYHLRILVQNLVSVIPLHKGVGVYLGLESALPNLFFCLHLFDQSSHLFLLLLQIQCPVIKGDLLASTLSNCYILLFDAIALAWRILFGCLLAHCVVEQLAYACL